MGKGCELELGLRFDYTAGVGMGLLYVERHFFLSFCCRGRVCVCVCVCVCV